MVPDQAFNPRHQFLTTSIWLNNQPDLLIANLKGGVIQFTEEEEQNKEKKNNSTAWNWSEEATLWLENSQKYQVCSVYVYSISSTLFFCLICYMC